MRRKSAPPTALRFWDLGEEWQKLTQLPFVYALWLIRREVASPKPIADSLRARRDKNLLELDMVIAAQNEFSPQFCAYYFRECLTYHFGQLEREGLSMFRKLCEKHGILQRDPTLVLQDVRNDFVSECSAREDYGVVLAGTPLTVDEAATVALRRETRAARNGKDMPVYNRGDKLAAE